MPRFLLLVVLLGALLSTAAAAQQPPRLIADLNTTPVDGEPLNLTVYDGALYMSAGEKLFRYTPDGTVEPTADSLSLDAVNRDQNALTVIGDYLYFLAIGNGVNGLAHYDARADAVTAIPTTDARMPNTQAGAPVEYNGKVYYGLRSTIDFKNRLYVYDPATGTTRRVTGSGASPDFERPTRLFVHNGFLFFSAVTSAEGEELFAYSDVNDTVTLVGDINPGTQSSNPARLLTVGDSLYFTARGPVSPGSTSLDYFVYNYDTRTGALTRPSGFRPTAGELTAYDGKIYYTALPADRTIGSELHEYDPATLTSRLVADTYTGRFASASPISRVVYDGKLYFNSITGDSGDFENRQIGLHVYDSATDAVTLVYEVSNAFTGQNAAFPVVFDDQIFYPGAETAGEAELYAYDPATGQGRRAADVGAGTLSSNPFFLKEHDGDLYFSVSAPVARMMRYDPDTDAVEALNRVFASELISFGDDLFVVAEVDPAVGIELYRYDAVADTVVLVEDLAPGDADARPGTFTEYDGDLYFRATGNQGLGVTGPGLFAYDPDTERVRFTSTLAPQHTAVLRDTLYMTANVDTTGTELFYYEAAGRTSGLAYEFARGASSTDMGELVVLRDTLYMAAGGFSSARLFSLDSLGAATQYATGNARDLRLLTVAGGRIYMRATHSFGAGTELYVFDPAVGAIELAADLLPQANASSSPTGLTVVGEQLYFGAIGSVRGDEYHIYTYDPVAKEARVLASLEKPRIPRRTFTNPNVTSFEAIGNALYLSAVAGDFGRELMALGLTPTSIEAPEQPGAANRFAVYPNPASDAATLIVGDGADRAHVALYDVLGRQVALLHDGPLAIDARIAVPTDGLPAGLYLVAVRTARGVRTQALTVVR